MIEHTHETGGAWAVTQWKVPGCPACLHWTEAERAIAEQAWDQAVKAVANVDPAAIHNPYRKEG